MAHVYAAKLQLSKILFMRAGTDTINKTESNLNF
jgi:hypothetical protein